MNVTDLENAINAANLPTDPKAVAAASALTIEPVDTRDWREFGDFFDRPDSRSVVYQWSEGGRQYMAQAAFLSVVSTDKDFAIHTLRRDLLKLKLAPFVSVKAFLAKPSVIALVCDPDPGEQPDTTMYKDLRGPVPAKRRWAAFCFLHGMRFLPPNGEEALNRKSLQQIGCGSAVNEGETGLRVERLNDPVLRESYEALKEELPIIEGTLDESPEEAAVQESLYPEQRMPPKETTAYLRPDGKTETVVTGIADPVEVISYQYPEFAAAAKKHGVDLTKPPGRELEEMRKYFGQGSGLYLVTVDFQVARTEAFKLDERAQRRMLKALNPPKRKKLAKKVKKPIKKSIKKKSVKRRR